MKATKPAPAPADALILSARDARALIEAGDGDAALLYLYALCQNDLDGERAAEALHRSVREVEAAARTLRRLGFPSFGAPAEAPARPVPRRSRRDPQFTGLVEAVQQELGKKLSTPELDLLFEIYGELALSADAIFILTKYCRDTAARRGPGRSASLSHIKKQAYAWANEEILTGEQAEQWVEARLWERSALGRLQGALGLGGRRLAPTEREYLKKWLELGFPEETIALAADRTITRTGGLKWQYADAMIRSWHQQGLRTPEEIEAGDRRPDRAGRRAAVTAPSRADDRALAQMARLREKMQNS